MKNKIAFRFARALLFLLLGAGGIAVLDIGAGLRTMSFDQIFNFAEGCLWFGIALVLGFRSSRVKYEWLMLISAWSFFAFGISDLIEISTGAWYRPWTLFALKAACVISFVAELSYYRSQIKKETRT